MLPEEAPFKCPKCEYTTKKRYELVLHFGITHKMVLTFLEQAAEKGQNLVVKAAIKPKEDQRNSTSVVAKLTQNSTHRQNDQLAFTCPFCPLKVSFALRRNHLTKHLYAQLSAEIAENSPCSEEPPFSCYLCRHIGNSSLQYTKWHFAKKKLIITILLSRGSKQPHQTCRSHSQSGGPICQRLPRNGCQGRTK